MALSDLIYRQTKQIGERHEGPHSVIGRYREQLWQPLEGGSG